MNASAACTGPMARPPVIVVVTFTFVGVSFLITRFESDCARSVMKSDDVLLSFVIDGSADMRSKMRMEAVDVVEGWDENAHASPCVDVGVGCPTQ